jgi:uncharacterized protein (UPF0548 family)
MSRRNTHSPATSLSGSFGKVQVVGSPAGVVLDVQGVERDTYGYKTMNHGLARLDRRTAIRVSSMLRAAIAAMATFASPAVPTSSIAHAGDVSQDFRASVCRGIRAAERAPPARRPEAEAA